MKFALAVKNRSYYSKVTTGGKPPLAFTGLNSPLRGDKALIMRAMDLDGGSSFEYANWDLKHDEDVCLLAVMLDPRNFGHLPDAMRNDRELVLSALRGVGHGEAEIRGIASIFWCVPDHLRADRECVVEAVKKDPWAVRYSARRYGPYVV